MRERRIATYAAGIIFSIRLALGAQSALSAQPLSIAPEDLRIEQRGDPGYHLWIKAKAGLGSVLLVESTKDPAGKTDNYAYRSKERNEVNGEARRLLNGEFIPLEKEVWSLVDSEPEDDEAFGRAFHIFVPWVAIWGYPDTRNGEIFIADGSFIGIRAFEKPWADYSGAWKDNPYQIRVTQKPLPALVERKAGDTMGLIEEALPASGGTSLDLVICLDTTSSMEPYIEDVKRGLVPLMEDITGNYSSFRVGILLYKDYFEEYLTRSHPFSAEPAAIQRHLDAIRVWGGRDVPEAVNEALYAALDGYAWTAEERLIIQVGDAPAHPLPRGKITEASVRALAGKLSVRIESLDLTRLSRPEAASPSPLAPGPSSSFTWPAP